MSVPKYTACMVDVFDTVLSVDFPRHNASLAERAGVEAASFGAAIGEWASSVMDGSTTIGLALKEALRRCGSTADDDRLAQLVAADQEFLHELTVLHDDTVPFLDSLRSKGVRTAFVSNCAENTRPLLDFLGLSGLVDEVVLSCEVGATKPDPPIYQAALQRLGVAAEQTLFVDDQVACCDGAAALGMHTVLIDRFDGAGVASTLTELSPYF